MLNAHLYVNLLDVNPEPSELFCMSHKLFYSSNVFSIIEYSDEFNSFSVPAGDKKAFSTVLSNNYNVVNNDDHKAFDLLRQLRSPKVMTCYKSVGRTVLERIIESFSPDLVLCDRKSLSICVKQIPQFNYLSFDEIPGMPAMLMNSEIFIGGLPEAVDLLLSHCGRLDALCRKVKSRDTMILDLDDLHPRFGFYPVDISGPWSWAWTGPTNSAHFFLRRNAFQRHKITLFFFSSKIPIDKTNLVVLVDGELVSLNYLENYKKVEFSLPPTLVASDIRVELRTQKCVVTEDFSKRVGIALHKVRIEEIP